MTLERGHQVDVYVEVHGDESESLASTHTGTTVPSWFLWSRDPVALVFRLTKTGGARADRQPILRPRMNVLAIDEIRLSGSATNQPSSYD